METQLLMNRVQAFITDAIGDNYTSDYFLLRRGLRKTKVLRRVELSSVAAALQYMKLLLYMKRRRSPAESEVIHKHSTT